jgi:hypothetical protein
MRRSEQLPYLTAFYIIVGVMTDKGTSGEDS